mmetsp:Transcript_16613/g.25005  ORF Transcript_16613/g.25005 Transcript_16613/m.25005 type:complete len:96 (+) Transcript_16613:1195-1482(+)
MERCVIHFTNFEFKEAVELFTGLHDASKLLSESRKNLFTIAVSNLQTSPSVKYDKTYSCSIFTGKLNKFMPLMQILFKLLQKAKEDTYKGFDKCK